MNTEVVARLEASFESDEDMTSLQDRVAELYDMIADMDKQIGRMENDISTVREMAGMHDRNFR